jgi:ElaB/YqjD/DUF883 family membrane-anchored ribosome-binding protein
MAAARASKKAKSAGDLETELETLRQDLTRLTDQLGQLATRKGREAATAELDVAGNVADTFEESVQERPLATLGLAVGLGFLMGAMWRK